jgi:hypothetical protein
MKSRKFKKRFSLNKQKVAKLTDQNQSKIYGGSEATHCGCPSYTWIICPSMTEPCNPPAPSQCCESNTSCYSVNYCPCN